MADNQLRIIVLGYLVRGPLGGFASYHLQYLLGLMRLGHDVYFVEDSDDYPGCYDPDTSDTITDPAYGLRFAERVFEQVGLDHRWAYHDAHAQRWHGPCVDQIGEDLSQRRSVAEHRWCQPDSSLVDDGAGSRLRRS